MKYLLSLLLILNAGPKEPPRPAETHIHYGYIVEEMKHIDDDQDEADNNEAVNIINNILNK